MASSVWKKWVLLTVFWVFCGATAHADDSLPWVLVDTHKQTLTVYQDKKILDKIDYVALGRGGTGVVRRIGDGKTPLGEFHVAWINDDSRFHIFFGLDYPTLSTVEKAYAMHRIDKPTFDSLVNSIDSTGLAYQDSPLGGSIGIHGIGDGDLRIHEKYNWTEGCVAVTNQQIEDLSRWVQLGTKVVIK